MQRAQILSFWLPDKLIVVLFCCLLSIQSIAQDNPVIDSLAQLVKSLPDDTNKVEALYELCWEEVHRNPSLGIDHGEQAYALATKLGWRKGLAYSQKYLGNCYHELGKHDSAIAKFNVALGLFDELNIRSSQAATLGNLGTLYEDIDDYPKAVEYHLQSLRIKEEDGNKTGMAYSYMGLGNIHHKMNRLDEALNYHKESLHLFEQANDPLNVSTCYYNISGIYHSQGKFEKALSNLDSVAEIFEAYQHYSGLTTVLQGRGILLEELDRHDEAKNTYDRALMYAEKVGDVYAQAICLVNVGKLHYSQNQLTEAIQSYEKSIELAESLGNKDVLLNAYENLSTIYKDAGRFEQALDFKNKYVHLKDSLFNIENSAVLEDLKLKYDTEKKEKELLNAEAIIKEQRAENAEQERDNAVTSKWLIVSVIGVCLFLVIALALLRISTLRRKANSELESRKQIIEERNQEIELLLGEIHHRVKNNLQVISSLLSLQERNVSDETAKSALMEGKERVQSIGMIHKLLYQNENFEGINMQDYVKELVESLTDTFYAGNKSLKTDLNFDALKLDVDSAVTVGLIINELVLNALKYAYKATEVPRLRVHLAQDQDDLVLTVQDNGSGSAETVEGSKSFGLKLVRSLTRQLGGSMDVQSEDGLKFQLRFADYKIVN